MDDCPARCIRGLRKAEHVTAEGAVTSMAFHPAWGSADRHPNGDYETSINWEDNEGVILFTLQRREQSQFGVAVLDRIDIESENARRKEHLGINNAVTYERSPKPGNKYHGNIIFSGAMTSALVKMVAAALANSARLIPRRD